MSNQRKTVFGLAGLCALLVLALVFALARNSGRNSEREETRESVQNALQSMPFSSERAHAQDSSSASNLKQLGLAIMQYSQANKDNFPPMNSMESLKAAVSSFTGATSDIYAQPSTKILYSVNSALSAKPIMQIADPSQIVMIYETDLGTNDSRAVLFADGHVKRMSEQDWQVTKQASGIQ